MSTATLPPIPVEPVIFSRDGTPSEWISGEIIEKQRAAVTKIVIGALPENYTMPESPAVPVGTDLSWLGCALSEIGDHFPNLTHLYLWSVGGLDSLSGLPAGLQCLDVRFCPDLREIRTIPPSQLDTLVLEHNPALSLIPEFTEALPDLYDATFKNSPGVEETVIHSLLSQASRLSRFDASACTQLRTIPSLPPSLVDLRLNDTPDLATLPPASPPALRRLDLQRSGIQSLPDFPATLDYIDLRKTTTLRRLPAIAGRPRTLMIHGSQLELPPELFGESEDSNTAPEILAHLDSLTHGVAYDHEVKVILLGNGRCGKSSLARRLIEDGFNKDETSTHGIRLWPRKEWNFSPVDDPEVEATAYLNFWDFAGQDLYHNTHRLFLQSKAIFLICGTDHGDGHSPESDGLDDDGLDEGEDFRRGPLYWLEQVESLGNMPGMDAPPPVLLVRTKADRDAEAVVTTRWWTRVDTEIGERPDLKRLDSSAKDPALNEDIQEWIRSAVSRVLGPAGRREIGSEALLVKQAIQEKKDANDAAHAATETNSEYVAPPAPVLAKTDFEELVSPLCAGSIYAANPSLLLERFHLGGFLYYNKPFLPERIILDQRWAVNGIYGLFDRTRGAWQNLEQSEGKFTFTELGQWAWNPRDRLDGTTDLGFPEDVQATFLQFMLACGICFELVPSQYRDDDRETIYLAPAGFPDHADSAVRVRDQRGGITHADTVTISGKGVRRESMVQLLVALGREWRRTAIFWKWGGQFESFKEEVYSDNRTFVHLEWTSRDEASYGGTITVQRFGPDASFLHAILNEARQLPGFERAGFSEQPIQHDPRRTETLTELDLGKEKISRSGDIFSVEAHHPKEEDSIGVEIGISYAGDSAGAAVEDWRDIPDDSIEKWPRALAASLEARRLSVEHYRTEQGRMDHEQSNARKKYLDHLTSRDYMIAFLSDAYLRSPYCMYELLQIYKRMGKGDLDKAIATLARYRDAPFSQTPCDDPYDEIIRDHWMEKLEKYQVWIAKRARPKGDADFIAMAKKAASVAYAEWMEFVRDESALDELLDKLNGNWACRLLSSLDAPEPDVNRWSEEIVSNIGRAEVLLDYAKQAWKNSYTEGISDSEGESEAAHAVALFLAAIRRAPDFAPDRLKEILSEKRQDRTLEQIRREALDREFPSS